MVASDPQNVEHGAEVAGDKPMNDRRGTGSGDEDLPLIDEYGKIPRFREHRLGDRHQGKARREDEPRQSQCLCSLLLDLA